MRILLDENLPRRLKRLFPQEHDVMTVPERGWAGLKNGRLLQAAELEFEILVTMDNGIRYQQNLSVTTLCIIQLVAISNQLEDLRPLMPQVCDLLDQIQPGSVTQVAAP